MKISAAGRACVGAATLAVGILVFGQGNATTEDRALKLYNIHTKDTATIVFKRDGVYDQQGLDQLDQFLRDWRKNRPTNMDPHLFDLLWSVYQESGSNDFIHVVCGYRSPETNAMLRRRSKMVAEHSQHILGKATDFFIPDVPLAKLREIGLRMQVGGVGFYPTSGSPFVHMDTGSPRMWPRMTHDQLARVFPNGHTLYIPSDGKPLPGYDEALAAYQTRKGQGASPVLVASADSGDTMDDASDSGDDVMPLPRVSPPKPTVVASLDDGQDSTDNAPTIQKLFGADKVVVLSPRQRLQAAHDASDADFNTAFDESVAQVPAALARSMAARELAAHVPKTAMPIAPTAVVATVDVTRPLRAEAITTAVLRTNDKPPQSIPELLAYAASGDLPQTAAQEAPRLASAAPGAVPLPQLSPLSGSGDDAARAVPTSTPVNAASVYSRLPAYALTMTAPDTQTLRMWSAGQSTREKRYALLTLPDFAQMPSLLDKPEVAYAAGFSTTAYVGLRTDHFAGPLVQPPTVVDLKYSAVVAAR